MFGNGEHVVYNFYKVFYHWMFQAEIFMADRYFQLIGVEHEFY